MLMVSRESHAFPPSVSRSTGTEPTVATAGFASGPPSREITHRCLPEATSPAPVAGRSPRRTACSAPAGVPPSPGGETSSAFPAPVSDCRGVGAVATDRSGSGRQ